MKTFPQIKEHCGGISKAEIDAFEKRRGVTLPADYREFLAVCDGGHLVDNTLRLDRPETEGFELTLRKLRSIKKQELLFDHLEGAQNCFSDRIPEDFLIIGYDWGGNQFIMQSEPPHQIFWVDMDFSDIYPIATGFTDLLSRVIPKSE